MRVLRPDIFLSAILTSALWSTPASAGLLGDLVCGILGCGGGSGGGGGGGGGGTAVPEIDAGAGFATVALVGCVAAVVYRKFKG